MLNIQVIASLAFVALLAVAPICRGQSNAVERAPDIILMMADDLGFSDIGCYGSEIPTPNLNALADRGVVFSNFSNTSRCCPSRASLLTGLYSHRAGIGDMNYSDKGPGYRGQLVPEVSTLPELLLANGYSTAMVGKWHLTRSGTINDGPNGSWPLQRGFERFFGSMEGAKNYFRPTWLFDQTQEIHAFDEQFFYTNAVSDRAAEWIQDQPKNKPIFLYSAFYAPHFPLQAPQEAIDRHQGNYSQGWDKLRAERLAKQIRLGVVPKDAKLTQRPVDVPAWQSLTKSQRDELDLRMATYAAQVELLDRGVGKIIGALRDTGRLENALVVFLSDNGGASPGGPFGAGPAEKVGKPNAPTKTTYGKGWATLSNTPYRMHKANTHEGGVMSPLLIHWPQRFGSQRIVRHDVAHIVDIAPTLVSAASPSSKAQSFDGINLLARRRNESDSVFYEHEKSRAIRQGKWKLVNRGKSQDWELFDLSSDRTELDDISKIHINRAADLEAAWLDWATKNNVKKK